MFVAPWSATQGHQLPTAIPRDVLSAAPGLCWIQWLVQARRLSDYPDVCERARLERRDRERATNA